MSKRSRHAVRHDIESLDAIEEAELEHELSDTTTGQAAATSSSKGEASTLISPREPASDDRWLGGDLPAESVPISGVNGCLLMDELDRLYQVWFGQSFFQTRRKNA